LWCFNHTHDKCVLEDPLIGDALMGHHAACDSTSTVAGEGLKNRSLDVHMHAPERAAASARSPRPILYDRCTCNDFD
jgi:hypothetical protein